jgi:hypothetical protein
MMADTAAPCFGHVTMFSHTCGLAWLTYPPRAVNEESPTSKSFFFTFFAAETAEWRIAGPGQRVLLHRQWKMLLAGVLPR